MTPRRPSAPRARAIALARPSLDVRWLALAAAAATVVALAFLR